ncbi:MAG: RNA polymerase sigma factor [Cytophagaceae bacterium]
MNDQQIISLIKSGQRTKAFELIYNNFTMVRKMIFEKGGNTEDAKDIFQDSLIVFYRYVLKDDFNLKSSISTFIYSISYKLWMRKLRNNPTYISYPEDSLSTDNIPDEEHLNEFDTIKTAERIVTELGEPCKSILQYFYYEKMSMKEIAQQMNYANENTVKAQKYKCIERSKKLLGKTLNFVKSFI